METLRKLESYNDSRGNSVDYEGLPVTSGVTVKFRGKNNRLEVASDAKIKHLSVDFWGENARVVIGPTLEPRTGLRFSIRMGHLATITIGENVGCTARAFITASEGATLAIGNDCMLAGGVEIRTDDAHALYDTRTGERINPSGSVTLGDHVWLGKFAAVMGGVTIGSGSTIGFRSIVTHDVPNNCVAAGSPAKVIRRDTVWERPMIAGIESNNSDSIPSNYSGAYWNLTAQEGEPIQPTGKSSEQSFE